MAMTTQERCMIILEACGRQTSKDPIEVFESLVALDAVNMHGPEHHFLDGASVLVAMRNAGADIDLDSLLPKLMEQALQMPGAMCGKWGACGSATSVGAAFALVEGTGPLTTDSSWGSHMAYVAGVLADQAAIGGPRCCKRDGLIAVALAAEYAKLRFGVELGSTTPKCAHFARNAQCIGERCPFFPAD